MPKLFATACLFLLLAGSSSAQRIWVAFFVDGLTGIETCRNLEAEISELDGVLSVRAEAHQGNVLVFFESATDYSEDLFREFLQTAGYHAWCFRQGILGQDQITRVSRSLCAGEQK